MANTPRLTIPYPAGTDIPDGAAQMQAIAQRLDAIATMYAQGTLAARPAAGIQGRLYLATDTGELFVDNGTQWIAMTPQTSARMFDYGDLKYSSRTAEHSGWIFPDGRSLAAGVYASLRARLVADGNPYGVTGSDPRIPDLRGRSLVGAGAGAGLTTRTVGQNGGAETHTLSTAQMPSHSHGGATGAADRDHTHGYTQTIYWGVGAAGGGVPAAGAGYQGASTGGQSQNHLHGIGAEGGGSSHPNMPPFVVGQWFIYGGAAA